MTPFPLVDVSCPSLDEVVSCVAQVLGIEEGEVDADARLTELGLESFTAVRLRRRLHERIGADLPIASFLGEASARSIARWVTPEDAAFPLTAAQSAYWVGRDPAFPLGGVATFFFHEYDRRPDDRPADLDRLEQAWNVLVEHHPMLRMVVGDDGRQRILASPGPYRIGRTDLREASAEEARQVLDRLRAERSHQLRPTDVWPLFDIHAALLPDGRTRLFVGMDILALDMASWLLVMRQWGELVADPAARPAPCATDFPTVVRERESDPEERERRALAGAYWAERAPDLPPGPTLPLAVPIEEVGVPRFARYEGRLAAEEWKLLRARAAEHGLSPTGVLLAAFALTLHRRAASDPFCLNVTLFDRPDRPELRDVVGDFTTTALVGIPVPDLSGPWTFSEWATEVNQRFWTDLEHRAVSGVEALRAAGRTSGMPAHPVVFTSGVGLADDEATAWLGEEVFGVSQTPQVLLDHIVRDDGGPLRIAWDAVETALPEEWVQGCLDAEVRLLRRLTDPAAWTSATLAADPGFHADEPLECVPFPGAGPLLDDPWAEAARRDPGAPALLGPGGAMTHGELAEAAGTLAAGVKPGEPVAVALDKGFDQITAVLAVAAAGAWYVPVEPSWPAARVASVCHQAGVAHAIAADGGPVTWPDGVTVHRVGDHLSPVNGQVLERPAPGDLAYAIFTSGSTGTPKGVAIEHRAARTTVDDIVDRFGIDHRDRVLGLSALSFDLSVFDVFGVLGAGGALVLPEPARQRDPEHWLELAERHGVTVWNTAPALLEMLVEYAELDPDAARRQLRSLRLVMLSGDWIPVTLPERLRALAPQARLYSLGGATEASIWSISYPVEEVDPAWKSIPYGRALRGQSFRILDEDGVPVPLGEPGELYIGGDGLARGYLGDPEQTAVRFAVHPRLGERLYRTGDLGRWRPDGTIEFLGRVDRQVKIRGHRIELGEIEAVLAREPGVRACVAATVRGSDGRPRLVAYVVGKESLSEERLTAALRERLPAYMVPARLVILDRLPVTANGKVDHAALPDPYTRASRPAAEKAAEEHVDVRSDGSRDLADWAARVLREAQERGLELVLTIRPGVLEPSATFRTSDPEPAPTGPDGPRGPGGESGAPADPEVLRSVASVFEELLGHPVDPDATFFDLGATSITLVMAHRELRRLAPGLSVVDLFERPTARALAAHIARRTAPPKPARVADSEPAYDVDPSTARGSRLRARAHAEEVSR
ncbi:amino acid adenylation domain-containing protein [Nonomuraea angiospora]|uniref:Phenyloxazoline synthase MbtB n=1 Tax=Nonomuraea angiospora TaxID=46172 RepID=A0ABR9LU59_9ACTN|nr:amino acid adenylation domain-containing protein [Nonomuraea angiospora]MBE1584195.1 amino acid adenylation domain-containing protein [Nonomuraea angiospora]